MESKEWLRYIRNVTPYVPGEQPKGERMIKLNTNENPYPPSPMVRELMKELDYERLRLYPEADADELARALAEYYHVDENQVFVGVGSDDVLAVSFLTFFNSNKPVLFPDVTYSFYDVWADLYGIPYERPCLDEKFHIIKEDYYTENGGIVIANPNAPTSIGVDRGFIRDVLEHNRNSIVIVDEAYIDFGGESALELLPEFENLLVVRTYSKSRSMAGARIGFAIGAPLLVKSLKDVKNSINSYTMNTFSILLGIESLKDEEYYKETLGKIMDTRRYTTDELRNMGFRVMDSLTNFLFISHKEKKAYELFTELREREILVRHFNLNRIKDYLRVTIGTDEEMSVFLKAIRECM